MSENEEREESGSHRRSAATVSIPVDSRTLIMAVVLFLGGGGGTFAGHVFTSGPTEELRRKVDDIDKKLDLLVDEGHRNDADIARHTQRLDELEHRMTVVEERTRAPK